MWGWRETIFHYYFGFSLSKCQQGYSNIVKMEDVVLEQISWTGSVQWWWKSQKMNSQPVGTGNIDTITILFNMHFLNVLFFCVKLLFKHLFLFLIDKMLPGRYPTGSSGIRQKAWVYCKVYACPRMPGLPRAPGTVMGRTPLCGAGLLGWVPLLPFLQGLLNQSFSCFNSRFNLSSQQFVQILRGG